MACIYLLCGVRGRGLAWATDWGRGLTWAIDRQGAWLVMDLKQGGVAWRLQTGRRGLAWATDGAWPGMGYRQGAWLGSSYRLGGVAWPGGGYRQEAWLGSDHMLVKAGHKYCSLLQ